MNEYAIEVFENTPARLAGIDILISKRGSQGWDVHKIWETYRGSHVVILYKRVRDR